MSRKLKDFSQDSHNANKGSARGQKQITGSIQRNGFGRSMVADKNRVMVGGNKTIEASAEVFGVEVEPIIIESDGTRPIIHVRTDLDLNDPNPNNPARRLAYEDNISSFLSFTLDPEVVTTDMSLGFDFEAIDVSLPELGEMLEGSVKELLGGGKETKDVAPKVELAKQLQEKWQTRLGQVWQLAEHRIAIADCTNEVAIKSLLNGERLNLVPTDPPYNVGIEYGEEVDDSKRDEDYEVFSQSWFRLWQSVSDRQLITPGYNNLACWSRLFEKPYHIGTWTKTNSMTRGHVSRFACYEPVLFYSRGWKRERHNDIFDYPVSEQSFATGEKLTAYHPCPKPLKMWLDLLENYSESGDLIGEPFLGSGTTLIACEQLGRKVRGCEISPDFAAVVIQRWVDLTGKEPVLLSE